MYLSDFGLTKRTSSDSGITKTGQFMGTVDYVAPEQIEGKAVDGRTDQYSLACVAYECLTGEPPYRRDTEVATIYAHLKDDPPSVRTTRPEVSPEADAALRRGMAKRPEDRFATCGDLAEGLGVAPPATAPVRRSTRERRWALLAGGAVLAVIVLIAALLPRGDDGGPGTTDPSFPAPIELDNTLVRIDAEANEATDVGTQVISGAAIAAGEGGVWVGRSQRSDVLHLDPETGALVEQIPDSGMGGEIVVGAGSVWLAPFDGVTKINPATDDIAARGLLAWEPEGRVYPRDLAFGAGSLFVLDTEGAIHRIDPFHYRVIQAAEASNDAFEVAVGVGAVWVTDAFQNTMTRFDPKSLEATGSFELPVTPDAMDIGFGSIWILNRSAGTITPIDPITGDAGEARRVGLQPRDLEMGLGSIWVANHGDGTVSRVDPATGIAETIDIGGPPAALAVDEETGFVWVLVAGCLNTVVC